ncbi:hypothetical protein [Fischerella sp. NIES-3754]|uniref:hypothetical protein n=1 Tax=Fischerella sp. NIES-3754 TaxID=1752063 RepID=UPI000ADEF7B1|nr:hypothetical protein [Fischerella sp. NIES-3754]
MNLQFTGMTRRSRDVAMLRLYVWSMIWHRTTKMYAHIIHDQIQQRHIFNYPFFRRSRQFV